MQKKFFLFFFQIDLSGKVLQGLVGQNHFTGKFKILLKDFYFSSLFEQIFNENKNVKKRYGTEHNKNKTSFYPIASLTFYSSVILKRCNLASMQLALTDQHVHCL